MLAITKWCLEAKKKKKKGCIHFSMAFLMSICIRPICIRPKLQSITFLLIVLYAGQRIVSLVKLL